MPFGAHETMEAHETLNELINMVDHFALYKAQVKDTVLSQMLDRHMETAIRTYNQLVAYTHDYQAVQATTGKSAAAGQQQVQYGLRQPSQQRPQLNSGSFDDRQIALAMLLAHKNAAKNCLASSLECADQNVRQILLNRAVNCVTEAYEVFQYMNQRGYYQVPTLESHTAKTMLHSYQPVQTTQYVQSAQPPQYTQPGQHMQYAQPIYHMQPFYPGQSTQPSQTGQSMQTQWQHVSPTQSVQPLPNAQTALHLQETYGHNLVTAYSPQTPQQTSQQQQQQHS